MIFQNPKYIRAQKVVSRNLKRSSYFGHSISKAIHFLSQAFLKKSGEKLFFCFPWCVVRNASCVVRGSGFVIGTLSVQLLLKF